MGAHKEGKDNFTRARYFTLLRSPGIDSKESIPPAYVAWRAGTADNPFLPRFLAPNIDCLKISAPACRPTSREQRVLTRSSSRCS
jgi:hypothetical protein